MSELIELKVKTPAGPATISVVRQGRVFEVRSFLVEGRPELSFAFWPESPGVEDLDGKSDLAQCFGLANKVRYGDVVLGTLEMRANSLEELQGALKQVKVRTFNHEEI